jgi:endonuclease/exonuclease/phosphatase family metal-dependent hydrolase
VPHILRVATYNVRDLKDDVHAAARVVQAIDPDVLCLQEVPRHLLSTYQIASFAARCGLHWSAGHRGSGGTTVMSSLRVEVANVRHRPLQVRRLQRQRGYAVTDVRLPGHEPVSVASIHLSLQAGERALHAATVLRELARQRADQADEADQALVVAGDLNEGPDGAAWQALAGRLRAVTGEAATYPAGSPRHRLDVIFASPGLPAVPSGPVELNRHDLVAATDHLPVWADLDLSRLAIP